MALTPMHVKTPAARLSFPNLFEPGLKQRGLPDVPENKEYSAAILLPPGTDLAPFKAAVKAVMLEKWGQEIKPRYPVLEKAEGKTTADGRAYSGYDEGWFVLRAKNKIAPQVVDGQRKPILALPPGTPEEQRVEAVARASAIVYPGCWCRFIIMAYAWDNKFGKGISWSLEAVQFAKDDSSFATRRIDATAEFDEIDTGDDAPPEETPVDDVLGDILN